MLQHLLARACVIGAVAVLGSCAVLPEAQPESKATQAQPEEIGSSRNAKVAFPDPKGTTLTFMGGSFSPEELDELKRIAPNLKLVTGLTREQALARAGEAHAIDGRFASAEFIERAPNLVWVQTMSAGVDNLLRLDPLMKNDRIALSNMRAVHGPTIADHSFAMLLMLTRNMREHERNQAQARWSRGGGSDDAPAPIALQGRTMLVVGLGGIGTEIAQRAHGFGMRVTAIRRSDAPAPEYVERLGHAADLLEMLKDADVVALAVPLTPETEGMFNAAAFGAMKQGSYLINIARGRVVDTAALMSALDSKKLAGACLDVTDPEPLPPDHPLWKLANVVITPHVAADAELTQERRWKVLKENLRRFAAGEPLLNVVDKKTGY